MYFFFFKLNFSVKSLLYWKKHNLITQIKQFFKNYFMSFGIDDDEFTQMVFENIDVDGDGNLSKEGK